MSKRTKMGFIFGDTTIQLFLLSLQVILPIGYEVTL